MRRLRRRWRARSCSACQRAAPFEDRPRERVVVDLVAAAAGRLQDPRLARQPLEHGRHLGLAEAGVLGEVGDAQRDLRARRRHELAQDRARRRALGLRQRGERVGDVRRDDPLGAAELAAACRRRSVREPRPRSSSQSRVITSCRYGVWMRPSSPAAPARRRRRSRRASRRVCCTPSSTASTSSGSIPARARRARGSTAPAAARSPRAPRRGRGARRARGGRAGPAAGPRGRRAAPASPRGSTAARSRRRRGARARAELGDERPARAPW